MTSYTNTNATVNALGQILQAATNTSSLTSVTTDDVTLTGAGTTASPISLKTISGVSGTYINPTVTINAYGQISSAKTNVFGSNLVCEPNSSGQTIANGITATIAGYSGGNGNSNFTESTGIYVLPVAGNWFVIACFNFSFASSLSDGNAVEISLYEGTTLLVGPFYYYTTAGATDLTVLLQGTADFTAGGNVTVSVTNNAGYTATLTNGSLTMWQSY